MTIIIIIIIIIINNKVATYKNAYMTQYYNFLHKISFAISYQIIDIQ